MFQYRAFGLNIQSGIEYPEFLPILFSEDPDVFLDHVEMGLDVKHELAIGRNKGKSDNYFFYAVKGVADYEVVDGTKIKVFVKPSADHAAVRLYCLSNAFAALLYQRKNIPLHAAALRVNDSVALFLGDSGTGKSTLMLSLSTKGYQVFSDDVCVPFIDASNEQVKVHASYPMMKCWATTIEMLGLDSRHFHPLKQGLDKFGFYFHESFELQPMVPKFIFFLEQSMDAEGVRFSQINGVEVFSRLAAQAYRSHHLQHEQHGQPLFSIFSQLSQQVKAFVIQRPVGLETYEQIGQKIIQQIMQ
jgi:hypothetical protein